MPDWFTLFIGTAVIAAILVGMALLVLSFRRLDDRNERRRLRVLVAGIMVGFAGLTPVSMAGFFNLPVWASEALRSPVALAGGNLVFLALPASFA